MSSSNTNSQAEFSDELVYTLSSVLHIRDHVPGQPMRTNEQRKHLRLLDGIALLLVTEARGDVAAVSFIHTATSIDFYFSKNRPCTSKEREYIDTLLRMIKDYPLFEVDKWSEEAMKTVLRMCIKKVKARFRKIISELRRCGLGVSSWNPDDISRLPIWHMPDHAGELVRVFTDGDEAESPDHGISSGQIMVHYLRKILEVGDSKDLLVDIDRIIAVLTLSHTIGIALRKDPVVSNPIITRRIQKLGDYAGAIELISSFLEKPEFYDRRCVITLKEIQAPGQPTHLLQRNYLQIINNYATANGEPAVEWGDIQNCFPSLKGAEAPQQGNMKVATSVHCECTVAAYMLENIPAQSIFEIGVSKHSCWLCERYLGFLAEYGGPTRAAKFIVSGLQEKIHAGWRPPPSPPEVIGRMIELISREMDEILGKIQRTNRSDSAPGSPGKGTRVSKFAKKIRAIFKDELTGSASSHNPE